MLNFPYKGVDLYFVHLRSLISLLPSLEPLSSFSCLYSRSVHNPLDRYHVPQPLAVMFPPSQLGADGFLYPIRPRNSPTQPGADELLPLEPGIPSQLSPPRPGAADLPPSKAWAAELSSTGQESLSSPVSA